MWSVSRAKRKLAPGAWCANNLNGSRYDCSNLIERSAAESRDLALSFLLGLIGEIPPLTLFGRNDKVGVLR